MTHLNLVRPAPDAPVTPNGFDHALTNEQLAFAAVIGRELAERWCADHTGDENTAVVDSDCSLLDNRC